MNKTSADIAGILIADWDPIGIADEPNARDEYDAYAGQIVRLLATGARESDLQAFLVKVSIEELGLAANPERAATAARHIIERFRRQG